jgi:hypothetical protein
MSDPSGEDSSAVQSRLPHEKEVSENLGLGLPYNLNAAERQLIEAVRKGEVAEPLPDDGETINPLQPSGWEERTVRASLLEALCSSENAEIQRRGIHLRGAFVEGQIDLRWAEIRCPVRFERCRFLEKVLLSHARAKMLAFDHCFLERGLVATHIDTMGDVTLVGAICRGPVGLRGASIGGDLNCGETNLQVDEGAALDAHGIQIAGAVNVSDGFSATGPVNFEKARIAQDLRCSGGGFTSKSGTALSAFSADITGDVFLNVATDKGEAIVDADHNPLRFQADGEVRLLGATIGGDLNCRGGLFRNAGRDALTADYLRVANSAFLNVATDAKGEAIVDADHNPLRFQADGQVRLPGATIGGQLNCRGGHFRNAGGNALNAFAAKITHDVVLADTEGQAIVDADDNLLRFQADGEVRLRGATIGGQLNCRGGLFRNQEGISLRADFAEVIGAFRWTGISETQGVSANEVSLRYASVGILDDDEVGWSAVKSFALDGFRYKALSPEAPRHWKKRAKWLAMQTSYASQPYQQLASVYQNVGDDAASRKILMEQFNAQLRKPHSSALPSRTKAWRWLLRGAVGHGYEPWRALGWALLIWLVAWFGVQAALGARAMVPTRSLPNETSTDDVSSPDPANQELAIDPEDCGQTNYPCLVPAIYAAELVFPIVNLDQRDNWRPNGPLGYRLITPVFVTLGWALTTLVVAGFTSLVRRD